MAKEVKKAEVKKAGAKKVAVESKGDKKADKKEIGKAMKKGKC
jgi:hypothetical protein